MNDYKTRTEKILEKINELATVSEDPDSITRIFGTDAFIAGRRKVVRWMHEAGLTVRIDNIGNVRGRINADRAEAKTFVIASHIDTVSNAGRFDGILGVIMGIELAENLIQTKTALPFHVEVIAFSDEEGVRFHSTFLGSRVVAGSFDAVLLEKKDQSGVKLKDAVTAMGGDVSNIQRDAILPGDWLGYFEIHIEQGPVLFKKNLPAALVTVIAGQKRAEINFKGVAGHAGTVPMPMRRDALCCAAEFILEIERLAVYQAGKIVATIGKLNIEHAASNVIPGEVSCTLDIRGKDKHLLADAYFALLESCKNIGLKRSVMIDWKLIQETDPVICDAGMNRILGKCLKDVTGECIEITSGAGHDAVAVSEVAPVCMLFVRCYEGISHNPLENVEAHDICKSLEIAERFIHHLIKHNSF